MQPRLASNLQSSCLSLSNAGITGVRHHGFLQGKKKFMKKLRQRSGSKSISLEPAMGPTDLDNDM
jgi:hypothetical protein